MRGCYGSSEVSLPCELPEDDSWPWGAIRLLGAGQLEQVTAGQTVRDRVSAWLVAVSRMVI